MVNREKILAYFTKAEEKQLAARGLDLAQLSLKTHTPKFTDFLDPYQREIIFTVFKQIPGMVFGENGGYQGAERARVIVAPEDYPFEAAGDKLAALEIEGNFNFQSLSHRDFLGALLALGIRREKIGDLLLGSGRCQVIVAEEMADYIADNLDKVHRVPVRVRRIGLAQLSVENERVKEIRATVVSLRLDAVASAGFGVSRTKTVQAITGEKLKLNWKITTRADEQVKEGDVISWRGKGRIVVDEVRGTTKKGRIGLILKKYI